LIVWNEFKINRANDCVFYEQLQWVIVDDLTTMLGPKSKDIFFVSVSSSSEEEEEEEDEEKPTRVPNRSVKQRSSSSGAITTSNKKEMAQRKASQDDSSDDELAVLRQRALQCNVSSEAQSIHSDDSDDMLSVLQQKALDQKNLLKKSASSEVTITVEKSSPKGDDKTKPTVKKRSMDAMKEKEAPKIKVAKNDPGEISLKALKNSKPERPKAKKLRLMNPSNDSSTNKKVQKSKSIANENNHGKTLKTVNIVEAVKIDESSSKVKVKSQVVDESGPSKDKSNDGHDFFVGQRNCNIHE